MTRAVEYELPPKQEVKNAFHRLRSDVIDWMQTHGAGWTPSAMDSGLKTVQGLGAWCFVVRPVCSHCGMGEQLLDDFSEYMEDMFEKCSVVRPIYVKDAGPLVRKPAHWAGKFLRIRDCHKLPVFSM